MLYRPALHGNSYALSLARRAFKEKFPTPTVPLTTVCKTVRYFCRILYILMKHEDKISLGMKYLACLIPE
jgi:hypothetical protein